MTEFQLEQLKELDTTLLCDGANEPIAMDQKIKPFYKTRMIVGEAFTVKCAKGDSLAVSRAIKTAPKGAVIVVDADGTDYNAMWGDVKSQMAKSLGLEGVVIDGAARDVHGCEMVGFPVYCKYTVCQASTKEDEGVLSATIVCGNQIVNSGDIIVGDENGVVVIRKDSLELTIKRAFEKKKKIESLLLRLQSGEEVNYG